MIATEPPAISTGQLALFIDFDGTMVPIQDDPATLFLSPAQMQVLDGLHHAMGGALAVVSGRDVRDVSGRVPEGVWRVGSHGLEALPPFEVAASVAAPAPIALVAAFATLETAFDDVRLEIKGEVLALHYRANPDIGPQLLNEAAAIVAEFADYRLQHGKMVIEAKPLRANKGRALTALMQSAPFAGRLPVMVGDDATDEDAINAALSLGGWAVKVGPGLSAAPYRLEAPAQVWRWLESEHS